jgi:hypothetical protein
MMPHPEHVTRRVVLPSGRMVDVVYFEGATLSEAPPAGPTATSSATPAQISDGLHVCPGCASPSVFPLAWQEAGREHWEMTLRCPNCEWHGNGVFEQELVERLEEELDAGTEALVRDLKRLTHANMEQELDRFAAALGGDRILPMDF